MEGEVGLVKEGLLESELGRKPIYRLTSLKTHKSLESLAESPASTHFLIRVQATLSMTAYAKLAKERFTGTKIFDYDQANGFVYFHLADTDSQ